MPHPDPDLKLDYDRPCVHHQCPTLLVGKANRVCLLDWILWLTNGQTISDVVLAGKGQPPGLIFSGGLLLPLYRPGRRAQPVRRAFDIDGLLDKLNGLYLAGCQYDESAGEAILCFSARHDHIETALAFDDLISRLGLKQWQDEDDLIEVAVHPESVRQLGR